MFAGKFGSIQKIVYGAPGTGKSFTTDGQLLDSDGTLLADRHRTTFHPDSDYSTFVGAYKPAMQSGSIVYVFRPQVFMDAYVSAWKNPQEQVVLIIEEINRGNCAQIFGDLFQLLDRDEDGFSTYPVKASVDMRDWLAEQFSEVDIADSKVKMGIELSLPPNLYIWATMNTSDQSLFPIDSAFKRRWDWKYVPIVKPAKDDDPEWRDRAIQVGDTYYDWWTFIDIINKHIGKATKSEDKQLGYFFVKAPDSTGVISVDQFVNKVLFYLFGDVFKDWNLPVEVFGKDDGKTYAFKDFFGTKIDEINIKTVAEFLDKLSWDKDKLKLVGTKMPPKTNKEKKDEKEAKAAAKAAAGGIGEAENQGDGE